MNSAKGRPEEAKRVIGTLGSAAIVAGSILGIGVFFSAPIVATNSPSVGVYLLVWLFGGLTALAGAASYAELGTMMPRGGGEFVYLREAFGSSVAFAGGWVVFGAIFTGSIATHAMVLAQYQVPTMLEFAVTALMGDDVVVRLDLPVIGPITGAKTLAVGFVALVTLLNAFGARVSAAAQTVMMLVPVTILTVISVYGLMVGGWPKQAQAAPVHGNDMWALALAYVPVYFAYSGWNALVYVAGEVCAPGRNIPLGLLGGTLLVTGLYLVLNLAFVAVLGLHGLAQVPEAGTAIAEALGGAPGKLLAAMVVAIGLLGCLNGEVLGGARVAWAMAREGALPSWIGTLAARSVAPVRALWLQAAISIALILTGTFEQILMLASLAMQLVGALTVAGVFALRRNHPSALRPYRVTAYPWLPLVYILASSIVVVMMAVRGLSSDSPGSWYPLVGVAVFLAALVVHRLGRRR
jgi:APA family basic amino acid/polyamine antiporter